MINGFPNIFPTFFPGNGGTGTLRMLQKDEAFEAVVEFHRGKIGWGGSPMKHGGFLHDLTVKHMNSTKKKWWFSHEQKLGMAFFYMKSSDFTNESWDLANERVICQSQSQSQGHDLWFNHMKHDSFQQRNTLGIWILPWIMGEHASNMWISPEIMDQTGDFTELGGVRPSYALHFLGQNIQDFWAKADKSAKLTESQPFSSSKSLSSRISNLAFLFTK